MSFPERLLMELEDESLEMVINGEKGPYIEHGRKRVYLSGENRKRAREAFSDLYK